MVFRPGMTATAMRAAILLVLLSTGCAHAPLVPRAWIGTTNARQVRYLHLASFVEDTPDAVVHDAILDEAQLASFEGGTACVDLVERTSVAYDEPIANLQPLCRGAVRQPAAVANEKISVKDYDFTTQQVVARVQELTPFGYSQTKIVEPTEVTFRVIERRARLCCPVGDDDVVRVLVKNSRMRVNDVGASYGEEFAWRIDGRR
jgi:hypothetical protein